MPIELNHTIIPAADKKESAKFLTGIPGLEAGSQWADFVPIRLANEVTLDFAERASFRPQHFAFLVGDAEFDAALAWLRDAGAAFDADFERSGRSEINRLYGGRGVYSDHPDGHPFELITRSNGPKPERWAKLSR